MYVYNISLYAMLDPALPYSTQTAMEFGLIILSTFALPYFLLHSSFVFGPIHLIVHDKFLIYSFM